MNGNASPLWFDINNKHVYYQLLYAYFSIISTKLSKMLGCIIFPVLFLFFSISLSFYFVQQFFAPRKLNSIPAGTYILFYDIER